MSVKYLETFTINRCTYGISRESAGFQCWRGGCGIGTVETMGDARKMLHSYAVSQNMAERGSGQTMVDNANAVLEKLGTDPFNLGRFLQ